jgi:DNA-binding CsgD family transcriptional regulator
MKDSVIKALLAKNRALEARVASLEEVINNLPVFLFLNQIDNLDDPDSRHNIWSNRQSLEFTGYTQAEIESMGSDYFTKVMHPDDLGVVEKALAFLKKQTEGEICGSIYRVKNKDQKYKWVSGRTLVYKRKADGQPFQFLNVAFDLCGEIHIEGRLEEATKVLNRLKNRERIANVSKCEENVLKLIVKGMTDKEIGDILCISKRTVQTHRNNLIHKKGLKNTADLVKFAIECGVY